MRNVANDREVNFGQSMLLFSRPRPYKDLTNAKLRLTARDVKPNLEKPS